MQIKINKETVDHILDSFMNQLILSGACITTDGDPVTRAKSVVFRSGVLDRARDFVTAVHTATITEGSLTDLANLKKMEEFIAHDEHQDINYR
jgi:hypothetical protein